MTRISRALRDLAKKRIGSAPPHYTNLEGYWRDVTVTIRAGLRVIKLSGATTFYCPDYLLLPEEGIDRALPWASLDTKTVALGKRELGCLLSWHDDA